MDKLMELPVKINNSNWYYEKPEGLTMVYLIYTENGDIASSNQFCVPWEHVLESVRRKYPELFKGEE